VILASQYGWHTIFPDRPPDFHELLLMAQLMSEERIGRYVRRDAGTTATQEADRLQRLRQYSE
jgi:hypothetical protein